MLEAQGFLQIEIGKPNSEYIAAQSHHTGI